MIDLEIFLHLPLFSMSLRLKSYGRIPSSAERVEFARKQLILTAGMKACKKPKGSFYLFPSLPDGIDDTRLAEKLVIRDGLVIPGSAFGAPGYIRVAALPYCEKLTGACDIIRIVINEMSGADKCLVKMHSC